METSKPHTKDRIIDAANKLFYAAGIKAVSVDAIAAQAGITKKTLYYHYRSKDDLITAYLTSRDQPNLALFAAWFEQEEGDLADKVAAIFVNLAKAAEHPKWQGCGFLRTTAELANMPGHPAIKVGVAHKKKFEAWLAGEFSARGIGAAEALARQVVLLMDGAFATMLLHRDPSYAQSAGEAARVLVGVACSGVKYNR